jgi:hypothetical protein
VSQLGECSELQAMRVGGAVVVRSQVELARHGVVSSWSGASRYAGVTRNSL